MLPDRWNPRVWLRDWLCKSTPAERARIEAIWEWRDRALAAIDSAPVVTQTEDGELRLSDSRLTARPRRLDS